jgi:uncharacterized membrane protein YjdF
MSLLWMSILFGVWMIGCRYEEDRAARLIEEVMRAHVVRRVLRRRQRARRKAALEERQKKVPS